MRVANLFEEILAGNCEAVFEQSCFLEPLAEQAHAARSGHVRGGEAAAGFQVGEDGRLFRDPVEFVDGERHAGVARDRKKMKDAVGRAARGEDRRDGVAQAPPA